MKIIIVTGFLIVIIITGTRSLDGCRSPGTVQWPRTIKPISCETRTVCATHAVRKRKTILMGKLQPRVSLEAKWIISCACSVLHEPWLPLRSPPACLQQVQGSAVVRVFLAVCHAQNHSKYSTGRRQMPNSKICQCSGMSFMKFISVNISCERKALHRANWIEVVGTP